MSSRLRAGPSSAARAQPLCPLSRRPRHVRAPGLARTRTVPAALGDALGAQPAAVTRGSVREAEARLLALIRRAPGSPEVATLRAQVAHLRSALEGPRVDADGAALLSQLTALRSENAALRDCNATQAAARPPAAWLTNGEGPDESDEELDEVQDEEEEALFEELRASTAAIDAELALLVSQETSAAAAASPAALGELLGPLDELLQSAAQVEQAASQALSARDTPLAPWAPTAPSDDVAPSSRVGDHRATLHALRVRKSDLLSQLAAQGVPLVAALQQAVEESLTEVVRTEGWRLQIEQQELEHVLELLRVDPEAGHATELATTLRLEAARGCTPPRAGPPAALQGQSQGPGPMAAGAEAEAEVEAEVEAEAASRVRGDVARAATRAFAQAAAAEEAGEGASTLASTASAAQAANQAVSAAVAEGAGEPAAAAAGAWQPAPEEGQQQQQLETAAARMQRLAAAQAELQRLREEQRALAAAVAASESVPSPPSPAAPSPSPLKSPPPPSYDASREDEDALRARVEVSRAASAVERGNSERRRQQASKAEAAASSSAAADATAAAATKRMEEQRQAAVDLVQAAAARRAAGAAAAVDRRRAEEAASAQAREAAAALAEQAAALEAQAWVQEQRRAADARAERDRAAAEHKAQAVRRAQEERAQQARQQAQKAAADAQADHERRTAAAKLSAERAAQRARLAAERATLEAVAAAQRDTAGAEQAASLAASLAQQSYDAARQAAWKGYLDLAASAAVHAPQDEQEATFWRSAVAAAQNVPPALARLLDQPPAQSPSAQSSSSSSPAVWHTVPSPPLPGAPLTLFYCPDAFNRPLKGRQQVFLHAGFNAWEQQAEIVTQMTPVDPDECDEESTPPGVLSSPDRRWFEHTLQLPVTAVSLDFVCSDGRDAWDNNGGDDYHAVAHSAAERAKTVRDARAMESLVAWRDARDKQARADAQRKAQRAKRAADAKAASKRVSARALARTMQTQPEMLTAGSAAQLRYNPQSTVLDGRNEVWVRGGYNRWKGDVRRWGPLRMTSLGDGGWLSASVEVPSDVWSLDCVFSDTGASSGGTYDNRGGLDYHVPVSGGVDAGGTAMSEPPLHVVSICVEMAPIAKVGGLGDVVTSLGRAVQEAGHHMEVILPKYDVLDYSQVFNIREERGFSWGGTYIKVFVGEVEGLSTYFLEPQNGMFSCGYIYGGSSDAHRFGFFSHAALEFLLQSGRQPDVAHIHDWQTAPAAKIYWDCYHKFGLPNTRFVFTIHNMNYGAGLIAEAVTYSQRVTTVSRTYAGEISGAGALKAHLGKFRGIVNGIDPEIWDPLNDKLLPCFYDQSSCASGKASAKKALRARLGLADRPDAPMVGVVTRLTGQKGTHLIKHALYRTLERGGQVALLGSAPDPKVQAEFQALADDLRRRWGSDAALVFKFDEPLSHLIYAGSDLLLVPSMFEPCGLSQLIAMRYGTLPLVRRTGGLADTVFDVDTDRERAAQAGLEPNGFVFEGQDGAAMDWALNRALDMWVGHRAEFKALQAACMAQDWSWNRPAEEYLELYYAATRS